jgi:hypothetical protein
MDLFSQKNVPLAIVPAEPICHRAAGDGATAAPSGGPHRQHLPMVIQ